MINQRLVRKDGNIISMLDNDWRNSAMLHDSGGGIRRLRYQALADKLLLLYIAKKIKDIKKHLGIVKLQKIVFFSQYQMQQDNVSGFHYSYVKDKHGARSSGIYVDRDHLGELELLNAKDTVILDEGCKYIESFDELFEKNQPVIDYIDGLIHEVGKLTSHEIKKYGHDYKIIQYGKKIKIDDIPMYHQILSPIRESEDTITFEIDDEWIDTLEFMFDSDLMEKYREANMQIKQGCTLLSHEDVFGHGH